MLAEFREPPRRRSLNEMRVAAIGQMLNSRAGVDREESKIASDILQVKKHCVEKLDFDMLENIDAAYQIGGFGLTIVRERRIIGKILEIRLTQVMQAAPQIAFTGAIIAHRLRAELLHHSLYG